MEIIKRASDMTAYCSDLKRTGKLSFIPTMGYLHEGHASLFRLGLEYGQHTVASVFVNPLQFGPDMDFDSYPRDLERDVKIMSECGVSAVFAPEVEEMYPQNFSSYVEETMLGSSGDGASREGYFRGICTVVLKLFNIVRPDFAVLGQKDIQQFYVLRRMARDLNTGVNLIMGDILREPDGLAMSSRNSYLVDPEDRAKATVLYEAIQLGKAKLSERRPLSEIVETVTNYLGASERVSKIHYVEVVDVETFRLANELVPDSEYSLMIAVQFCGVRLIDNLVFVY